MDEIKIKHRASAAKQLQNNEVLQECFDSVNDGLIQAMQIVPMTDRDTQQAITLSFQVLNNIKQHIQTCINDEKIHEFNLKSVSGIS